MLKFNKFICIIICFTCFFSFGNSVNADIEDVKIDNVVSGITDMLVAFGDGVIHLISSSVGETVTIDKLVFNDIDKLSIDYWNDDTSISDTGEKPLKAFMAPVVEKWYAVFFKVSIMVYMVVLVYIGISIMFSSTAEKKANFKDAIGNWVVGIIILLMFPYVMKYVIILNDSVVHTLQAKNGTTQNEDGELPNKNYWDMFSFYGSDEFVDYMGGTKETDMMVLTRVSAQKNNNGNGSISLAIIYLILIGQMLAILIMYYTRAFMIAFLITIFPLVTMTYVLDKMGDKKSQSFGIWFKEFVVNVIVQMFHAVVYLVITGAGIKSYINTGGQNFLFMLLCVLFLFEGEKILRSIFNVNSKAKSITDLAASGVLLFSAAKSMGALAKRGGDNVGNSEDTKDSKEAAARIKARKSRTQEENEAAKANMDEKAANGESLESHGEYQGKDNEPDGVSSKEFDVENSLDSNFSKAAKRRLNAGALRKTVRFATGAAGGTLGLGQAMATSDATPDKAMAGFMAGKATGNLLGTPLENVASGIEQHAMAYKMGNAIQKGKMDKELGLNEKAIEDLVEIPDGVDADDYKETSAFRDAVKERLEIERKAQIEFAKVAATKGRKAAEIRYFNYIEKETKK